MSVLALLAMPVVVLKNMEHQEQFSALGPECGLVFASRHGESIFAHRASTIRRAADSSGVVKQ